MFSLFGSDSDELKAINKLDKKLDTVIKNVQDMSKLLDGINFSNRVERKYGKSDIKLVDNTYKAVLSQLNLQKNLSSDSLARNRPLY